MFPSNLRLFFYLLNFLFFINLSFAQKGIDSTLYTVDFRFNDGLFLNFEQVKANNAVPLKNIISNEDYLTNNFISKILLSKEINFYYKGEKRTVTSSKIWGYAQNGVLYINTHNNFYRIPSIGPISFFVASVTVEYQSPIDPWSNSYYGIQNQSYTTSEIQRFLLDFNDGSLYNYSIKNIEKLISTDDVLYKDFMSLKKRIRKQKSFIYIRRFNENKPLYFPLYL